MPSDAGPGDPSDAGQDSGASDGGAGAAGDAGTVTPPAPLGGGDWLQYRFSPLGGDSENHGVFTADQVPNLTPAWTITDNRLGQYVYAQALITADTVYVNTAIGSSRVNALNAADGSVRWSQSFPGVVSAGCATHKLGIWAAPALAGGTLYAAAPDGKIHALDPATGAELWSAQVADPTAASNGEYMESSPSVSLALGKLYIGVASSDGCAPVRGRIASVDLATHAVATTMLVDAGLHGASVWTSISIDEAAGRLYASTGNHVEPLASEPLAQSIVAFDAATLAVVDHWQNPTALKDCDFGGSPALFAAADGTPLVAATSKDGALYVLRRDQLAAGPVWKAQLAVLDPAKPDTGGNATQGFGTLVSPTFAHGTLYAAGGRTPGGDPGSVVAFDPATGAVKWTRAMPGYVLTAMPAVGDVLIAESTLPDNTASFVSVLDQATGAELRRFPGGAAIYAGLSVGHGMIFWSDANGHATALVVPDYRK